MCLSSFSNGAFSIAPNGRLDAVWYDTRKAANNTDSQLFYPYSTDAGITWSPNVPVSNSLNPFEGYPGGSGKLALPGLPKAALSRCCPLRFNFVTIISEIDLDKIAVLN